MLDSSPISHFPVNGNSKPMTRRPYLPIKKLNVAFQHARKDLGRSMQQHSVEEGVASNYNTTVVDQFEKKTLDHHHSNR